MTRSELQAGEIGYVAMLSGWKATIVSPRHVRLEHSTHRDMAAIVKCSDDIGAIAEFEVEYENPERVPRPVRTLVKILLRKAMARNLRGNKV